MRYKLLFGLRLGNFISPTLTSCISTSTERNLILKAILQIMKHLSQHTTTTAHEMFTE